MTREEAIKVLNAVDENASCDDCLYYAQMEDCPTDDDCIIRKAIWMAIRALSQEPCDKPCDDAISREAANKKEINDVLEQIRAEIDDLDIYYDNDYFSGNRDAMFKCNDVLQIIDKYKASEEISERNMKMWEEIFKAERGGKE